MPIDIDLEWSVDTKGYRVIDGRIVGYGGPQRRYRVKEFPTLYTIFAKIRGPKELLDFVHRFGRLSLDKLNLPPTPIEGSLEVQPLVGDSVREVLSSIGTLSNFIKAVHDQGGTVPKWQGGAFEYEVDLPNIGRAIIRGGIPLPGKLSASLEPDPATGAWQLRLTPPTLLDAIWLQFGQAITSNAALRQCPHCGKWFEAGANVRRRQAKFCSDACRIEFNSHKRRRRIAHERPHP